LSEDRWSELEELMGEGADLLSDLKGHAVRVYTHNDADGLSAGAILTFTLRCLRIPATVRVLDNESDVLEHGLDGPTILLDMGSGILRHLSSDHPVLVVDHHEAPDEAPDNVTLVNPRRCGFNGGTEASASTVTYLLCKFLVKLERTELPKTALVGAYGDNQADRRGVRGLNRIPERDGEEGEVLEPRDPAYWTYGRATMTVGEIVETLSGPEVRRALEARFGELDRPPVELPREEECEIVEEHAQLTDLNGKTGYIHVFRDERPLAELRDPLETATLLNACGRYGEGWVGLVVAMGCWDHLDRAKRLRRKHRAVIREALSRLERGQGVRDRDGYLLVEGDRLGVPPTVIGIVSQIVCENEGKVVVGVSRVDDDTVKVSIRCPEDSGVDAGELASEAAERVGGEGGGHERAAGAEIPADRLDEFLRCLERTL